MVDMNYKTENRFLRKSHLVKLALVMVVILCFFALLSGVSAKNFNNTSTNTEIQDFISNQAETDNEIVFDAGNYSGLSNLNISRSIRISTNGTVNIQGTGTLFNITATNVQILKLNITGYETAVKSNTGNLSIIGCSITTNLVSIHLSGNSLTDISLENNTIISSSSSGAVYLTSGTGTNVNISFMNNNIRNRGTYYGYGVFFNVSSEVNSPNVNCINFNNNNISGGYGVYILANNSNNIINITNNNISGESYYGVYLVASTSSNNISVNNNNISGYYGLYLNVDNSTNTLLEFVGNIIISTSNYYYGMYIYIPSSSSSRNITGLSIINNTIRATSYGIYFSTSSATIFSDILIIGNTINVNGTSGVGITFATGVHTFNNVIVEYNVILASTGLNFNNVPSSLNGVSFNYNWWGTNAPVLNRFTLNNWFVIQLSVNNFNTTVTTNVSNIQQFGSSVNLSYQLVLYSNSTKSTSVVGYGDLPEFFVNLKWTGSDGTISQDLNAKGYYSKIVNFTSDSLFSFNVLTSSYGTVNFNVLVYGEERYVNGIYVNSSIINPGNGGSWTEAVRNISAALQIINQYNLNNVVIYVAGAGIGGAVDYIASAGNTNLVLNNNLTIMGMYGTPNIIGPGSGTLFTIAATNVSIINLNISGFTTAISANNNNVRNVYIIGNNITASGVGVNLGTDTGVLEQVILQNNNIVSSSSSTSAGAVTVVSGNTNNINVYFVNNNIRNIATGASNTCFAVYITISGTLNNPNVNSLNFNNNNITGHNGITITKFFSNIDTNNIINFSNNNIVTSYGPISLVLVNSNNTVSFTNNNISSSSSSVFLNLGNNRDTFVEFVDNNIIGQYCIYFSMNINTTIAGLSIINNIIKSNTTGTGRGIYFSTTNAVIFNNVLVTGNIIDVGDSNGIGIDFGTGAHTLNNVTVEYNVILARFGLNFTSSPSLNGVSFDYNWWGTNTPVVSRLSLNSWFVMQLSGDNFNTTNIITKFSNNPTLGSSVNLFYQLVLYDNSTKGTSVVGYGGLPDFLVSLSWLSNDGSISRDFNAKGYYSNVINFTSDTWFSFNALTRSYDSVAFNMVVYGEERNFDSIYVNSSISSSGNGGSWAEAVQNINTALQIINWYNLSNVVIYVAGAGIGGASDYFGNINLVLNTNLTIIGMYGTPNIVGPGSGSLFNITGANVTIVNLNIRGFATAINVNSSNVRNVYIINNTIVTSGVSINFVNNTNLSSVNITGNTISSSNVGVSFSTNSTVLEYIILQDNTIISSLSSSSSGAIYITSSTGKNLNISFINNNIINNANSNAYAIYISVSGVVTSLKINFMNFDNNNISGLGGVYITAGISNNTMSFTNNNMSGISIVASSSNNTMSFTNNNISGISHGLSLTASSSNNTINISNNKISGGNGTSGYGLQLVANNNRDNNINITNNNIFGSTYGLNLTTYSSNNTITITNNIISISNSNVSRVTYGVDLRAYNSTNNLLEFVNNIITGSTYGMYIGVPSSNNMIGLSIVNNTIKTNGTSGIGIGFVTAAGSIISDILVMGNIIDVASIVGTGIYFGSGSLTLNNVTVEYNVILACTGLNFTSTSSSLVDVSFDYNWWGTNNPVIDNFSLNNWFVMQLSGDNFNTTNTTTNVTNPTLGSSLNMSYHLVLYNNSTKSTSVVGYGTLPDFSVNLNWMSNDGSISRDFNAKGYYSNVVNFTSDTWFSFNALTRSYGTVDFNVDFNIWVYGGKRSFDSIYVNSSISSSGNGGSWAEAVQSIYDAIQIINLHNLSNVVIYVAGAGIGGAADYLASDGNRNLILDTNNITIIGVHGTPNIVGNALFNLFNITGNNVSLINLNISGYQIGISSNGSGLSVINCNIDTNNIGIHLFGPFLTNILLENNTITSMPSSSTQGVVYVNSTNGSILSITFKDNNIITAREYGNGVYIAASYCTNSITFINNTITSFWNTTSSSVGGRAITLAVPNSTNSINVINNTITGVMGGILISVTYSNNTINLINNNIKSSNGNGLSLSASYSDSNITFINNTITADLSAWASNGVHLQASNSSNNMIFTNNNFIGDHIGFYLEVYFSDYNVTFFENNFTANSVALRFDVYGNQENMATLYLLNNTLISDDIGIIAEFFNRNFNATNNAIVMGNTIISKNVGILIIDYYTLSRYGLITTEELTLPSFDTLFNMTANYNIILAPLGLYSMVNLNKSNFDYNFWGSNNIDDIKLDFNVQLLQLVYNDEDSYIKEISWTINSPTINNHYILNVTNLTSLDNLKIGDTVSFALLVLNTTLSNVGVENLPFFTINGTFNNKIFTTDRDQLFVFTAVLTEEGLHNITTSMIVSGCDGVQISTGGKQFRYSTYLYNQYSYELFNLESLFNVTEATPEIKTNAVDKATGSKNLVSNGIVTIVDTVNYTNLVVGETYTVNGVLMDKATGNPLIVNGATVTATKTFVASSSDGFVELEFTFDSSGLGDKTLVVFEKLFYAGVEIANHEDINDVNQTVRFEDAFEIKTNASEKDTGSKNIVANGIVTIVDTVTYTNLKVGEIYTVNGVLMDKATGNALIVNGATVTATKTFVASSVDGFVELEFTFDATSLGNKTLVVFEKLFYAGVEIANHEDINDVNQTVRLEDVPEIKINVPDLKSNAMDKETGSKNLISDGTVTIVDTLTYTNLVVGETYTVNGVLMDKATGNPLIVNGAEVRTSKTFVASRVNGSVEIEFTFDATGLGNKTLVVFEKLFYNGVEIATHEDIDDLNQTVIFKEKIIKIFDEEFEDEKEVEKDITENITDEEDIDEEFEDTEQNNEVDKEDNKVTANMKSTGIPIAMLLIIAILGLVTFRRKD